MTSLNAIKPIEDSVVYDYMLKKESEGKAKKVAKIAGLNKFLRIYYARVNEVYSKVQKQNMLENNVNMDICQTCK